MAQLDARLGVRRHDPLALRVVADDVGQRGPSPSAWQPNATPWPVCATYDSTGGTLEGLQLLRGSDGTRTIVSMPTPPTTKTSRSWVTASGSHSLRP